jgi:hypothetical protein
MLKKAASRDRTVQTVSRKNKGDHGRKKDGSIVHAPASGGNCEGHPLALSEWKCKEKTLTSNYQNKSSELEILIIKSNVSSEIGWLKRGLKEVLLQ